MRVSSFKSRYVQAPPRAGTPPQPVWEPLSPILRPAPLPAANPANGNNRSAYTSGSGGGNGIEGALHQTPVPNPSAHAHLHLPSPTVTYEPALHSAPLLHRAAPYPPILGSPIEALADAAISSANVSPANVGSAHPSSRLPTSPTTIPHPLGQRAPNRAYPGYANYTHDERPAKRARSEYFASPQYSQHYPRPATSHIPGWSYNVEHMVDNGVRMYQNNAPMPQYQDDLTQRRLLDAQLLLDFVAGASGSSSQSRSTAKRWSMSHSEGSAPYNQRHVDISPPYSGPSHAPVSRPPQILAPPEYMYNPEPPSNSLDPPTDPSAAQTQTPPEEPIAGAVSSALATGNGGLEEINLKGQKAWPKGKSRGSRNAVAGAKRKKSTPKPKSAPSSAAPEQLHSPQSLPAEQQDSRLRDANNRPAPVQAIREQTVRVRRHSFPTPALTQVNGDFNATVSRAKSVPLGAALVVIPPAEDVCSQLNSAAEPDTICAGCDSTDSETTIGDGEQWIRCDGCKEWYHFVCAGFKSEREVRDVDKFYCAPCRPKFGETTKVRKSTRAHTAVDYAGLNEGILKTSDDNPEHHYISAFKNGDIEFAPETFARLPPELISADFIEKTNGFKEPIVVPASLNPRPCFPAQQHQQPDDAAMETDDLGGERYAYEIAPDDGQDKLDMVIPKGLTVRRVSELYGPLERVPVIDVKAQEGEDKRWTMAKWADYYEQRGEKPVRNVISLEVSKSRLGRLIRRPKAVRDMDLQDSVWREDDKKAPPAVQFYCLMSVADCYTDFHIDFGGSSVYYHIVKGKKVFFFIPPTKQNLKKYEDWCLSPKQGHEFLGHQVKDCYRVDLYPGDTMLIPSGWIHAVWTPEDSLVIGGNFLTRMHYGMQIKILEIEKNTKVAPKFRYPFFQKLMWLALIKYLEEDAVPESVERLLLSGSPFHRDIPIFCETGNFGHNSHLGSQNYNRRYYSKAELEGLPDLANYIWRTVLISLGRIEGITETVRKAVTGSIPKSFGEPLVLARRFAMWIAWKKGNENIPQWAYPDATLPEAADSASEKKLSAAQVKRMEREAWSETLRATAERHSTRIKATELSLSNGVDGGRDSSLQPTPPPMLGFLQQTDPSRPLTTPKTSQLGPKRIACDACRKRRIRCKHKDDLVESSKSGGMNGGMNTIDLSGSLGLSVKRRYSDLDESYGQSDTADNTAVVNGGPLLADANADPYALKSGRVKACADCRKSKRRCIHDEYGNVDPVKANEVPIPRGAASKKRRISEEDSNFACRKMMTEEADDGLTVGPIRHRNSLPATLGMPISNELQDLAYSAQQALDQVQTEDDSMPIDPALQSYGHEDDAIMDDSAHYPSHIDAVIASVESHSNSLMDDIGEVAMGEPHGPSVEPLTPGPASDGGSVQPNRFKEGPSSSTARHNAMVAPPMTPTAPRSTRLSFSGRASPTPRSSNKRKHTPRSTSRSKGRHSREPIKREPQSEQRIRGLSSASGDDEKDTASLALALKLQMEEHGLRRRSK